MTLPGWIDRTLYPFVPRSFATLDGTMRYLDEGRGPTVLIVHGTPSWSFEWRCVVAALAPTHRVVVPDHLGFGLSDKPQNVSVLRPEDHAQRLAALVAALDLREVTLVAHDFGGPIALGATQLDLARVSSLVLSNTWLWSLSDRRDVRILSALVRSPLGRLLYRGFNASPRWILPSAFGDRRRLTRAVHRHYLAPFPRWRDRAAPWKLGVELAGSAAFYDGLWRDRQKFGALPTRLVWGDRDPTFRQPERERLQAAFPHAQLTRIADSGHFVAEEAPEALIAAIRGQTRA